MVDQGRVPYHEHDDTDVREALATALGERNRHLYQRLLVMFALVVLIGYFTLDGIHSAQEQSDRDRARFERSIVTNCESVVANTRRFNELIDKLVYAYATSPALTPKQREERSALLANSKQDVPVCPPLRKALS
jgi:hypothetical protein